MHSVAMNVNVLISASQALGGIALDNLENQNAIREAGGIDRLCDAMRAFPDNEQLKNNFSYAIGNLAKDNQINKDACREAGAIEILVGIASKSESSPE
jgi:hypothetical protein